jgi:hypothetical protein
MGSIARIAPELTEGFFDGANVIRPEPFMVEVGSFAPIEEWQFEETQISGWLGRVTAGQSAYLGKLVSLTPRFLNFTGGAPGGVVATIFAAEEIDKEQALFDGICWAEGL